MPGVPARAARTPAAAPDRLTITTGWLPEVTGKCVASTASPTTESGVVRKDSLSVNPVASNRNTPSATVPSASDVTSQTARGRRAMTAPARAHIPVALGSTEPYRGRTGQNTQRPTVTNSAGSSVSMTTTVTTMPIAATGPKP